MKNTWLFTCTFLVALLLTGCNSAEPGGNAAADASTSAADVGQAFVNDDLSAKNILQIAMASKDHSTLAAGVQAAGLENVLVNAGPLTVFAPTNAAFDKLPAGTLETLLKPENKATLGNIITYHASPGKYTEEMLKDGMKLFQATGDYVTVQKKDGATYVNGVKLEGTVEASNGIIHVVNTVMLPPEG
jgi:uncharacterized surface protein with fasciclin (FAS1) repeats